MPKKNKKDKYTLTKNRYLGIIFFGLVLISIIYIAHHEIKLYTPLETTRKEIVSSDITTTKSEEITTETEEIKTLRQALNKGNKQTFKIYQSMYTNEKITIDNFNEETILYLTYKAIEQETDLSLYTHYLTCEEALKVNLYDSIRQCGGGDISSTYYTSNSYITKELLKTKSRELYNVNIINYTNFYTSEDNVCYYLDDEYLCISHQTTITTDHPEVTFIKAIKENQTIKIYENYKYIENGIYYKYFNRNEIGEQEYVSTFTKVNGKYYWTSTEPVNE